MKKDTAAETVLIGETHLKNSAGALVPIENIKPIDLERDRLVREIALQAEDLAGRIAEFRLAVMQKIDAFVKKSAKQYRVKIGGVKGNIKLQAYDGSYTVVRDIDERTTFDERLQVAHELIRECIAEWSTDAPQELATLIGDAFRTDKEGRLNPHRIRRLRRYEFNHPKWRKAMKVLADAEQVQSSKEYVRIYKRAENGELLPVSLNVAG